MRLLMRFIMVCFLLVYTSRTYAEEPVVLSSSMDGVSVNYPEHFLDPNQKATFAEVSQGAFAHNFIKLKQKEASLGYSKAAHWFRFYLQNPTAQDLEIYLEISYPVLENIEIYLKSVNNETIFADPNIGVNFNAKKIRHHNFIFPLTVKKNSIITIYLRVVSSTAINVPISIWDKEALTSKITEEMLLFGMYYGILLVMIFYNLFLFLFTLDKSYGAYILYLCSFFSMQLSLQGFDTMYFWPTAPWISAKFRIIAVASCLLFAHQFSRSYLSTKKYVPRMDKVLIIIMSTAVLSMSLGLFYSYALGLQCLNLLMSSSWFLIVVGVMCYRRGLKPAKYFLLAWGIFCLGVSVFALCRLGFIPSNVLTKYSYYFGSTMEIVFLSIGLAYRITLLRQEKAQALLELKLSEEKANAAMHAMEKERVEKVLNTERDRIRTMLAMGDRLNSPLTALKNIWSFLRVKINTQKNNENTELSFEQLEKYVKIGETATLHLGELAKEINTYRESGLVFSNDELEITQKKRT